MADRRIPQDEASLTLARAAVGRGWVTPEQLREAQAGPSDTALQKGWHFLQHGQYEKAIVAFEIVLEGDPNNQEAKEGRSEALRQKAAKKDAAPKR